MLHPVACRSVGARSAQWRRRWIDAPPVTIDGEELYVINIGDMLEIMTAGPRRDDAPGAQGAQRAVFFPLFFACDYETKIRLCLN
jgi:isopenicillin N synthase-like dioxygenase